MADAGCPAPHPGAHLHRLPAQAGPAGVGPRRPPASGSLAVGRPAPGRGAWLCAGSEACFDAAVRRRAFGRALRCDVPAHELERLRGRLLSEGDSTSNGPDGPSIGRGWQNVDGEQEDPGHELARELGLSNKEALDLCERLRIGVKSHSSSIEDPMADRCAAWPTPRASDARHNPTSPNRRPPLWPPRAGGAGAPAEPAAPAHRVIRSTEGGSVRLAPRPTPRRPASAPGAPMPERVQPIQPAPGRSTRLQSSAPAAESRPPAEVRARRRRPPPRPRPLLRRPVPASAPLAPAAPVAVPAALAAVAPGRVVPASGPRWWRAGAGTVAPALLVPGARRRLVVPGGSGDRRPPPPPPRSMSGKPIPPPPGAPRTAGPGGGGSGGSGGAPGGWWRWRFPRSWRSRRWLPAAVSGGPRTGSGGPPRPGGGGFVPRARWSAPYRWRPRWWRLAGSLAAAVPVVAAVPAVAGSPAVPAVAVAPAAVVSPAAAGPVRSSGPGAKEARSRRRADAAFVAELHAGRRARTRGRDRRPPADDHPGAGAQAQPHGGRHRPHADDGRRDGHGHPVAGRRDDRADRRGARRRRDPRRARPGGRARAADALRRR